MSEEEQPFYFEDDLDFPFPRPLAKEKDEIPEPIIWQGTNLNRPLLREGQVCLLSGIAGTGKSFYALSLAIAGAYKKERFGEAGGMSVRTDQTADCVAYLSYEESGEEMRARVKEIAPRDGFDTDEALDRVYSYPKPPDLWQPKQDNDLLGEPGPHWRTFWEECKRFKRRWVILDNAESMMAAWDTNAPGAVRSFMNELAFEARRYKMGVLLITHPTKTATETLQQSGLISPGVVAGSAAYWNAARSVAVLWDLNKQLTILELVKSNHGPRGWGVLLERREAAPVWSGFQVKRLLEAADIEQLRKVYRPLRHPGKKKKKDMKGMEEEAMYELIDTIGVDGWKKGGASEAERAAV